MNGIRRVGDGHLSDTSNLNIEMKIDMKMNRAGRADYLPHLEVEMEPPRKDPPNMKINMNMRRGQSIFSNLKKEISIKIIIKMKVGGGSRLFSFF